MSKKARIVAFANQKGGVGKSTTTICAARAANVYHGARVLVLDMDPQGNTTSTLARDDYTAEDISLADAIVPETDVVLPEVILPSIWEGIDLAPGGETLAVAEQKILATAFGREHRLREALTPVLDNYDLVLIDNAPALGLLLINSLVAAHSAVLVTEADRWSADGLALLGKTLTGVRNYHNPQLEIAGTVVNKWRGTANEARTAEDMIEGMGRHFPGVPIWMDHRIPLWVGIKDTLDAGLGLDQAATKLRVLAEDTYKPITAQLLGVGVAA
ncbi:ParA family protein [Nocardia nova]|uniref:ParA family protein n=1 Tax=Nocardia nova TaxID=37330 RepID=UPI00189334D8|nr:AAA family ATPase [Nocardia nova]MBF6150266.1 AAA family ATPase [Nocardia nova]